MQKPLVLGGLLLVAGVLLGMFLGRAFAPGKSAVSNEAATAAGRSRSSMASSMEASLVTDAPEPAAEMSEPAAAVDLGSQEAPVSSVPVSAAEPLSLTESQAEQLRTLTKNAEALADTYDTSNYTPPEIPKDIEEKLQAISPELLALVKIASRIPPREVQENKR